MDPLHIRLREQVTLVVPARLNSITTYVLLEQETWFEKELGFLARWLKPGMTAIDVGANLGVYSLPMARLVGPEGRVFAYEPGSEARQLLEQSGKLNAASGLQVLDFALSDTERDGRLILGKSSELNALGETGDGEPVHITTLDAEDAKQGWSAPDFIKIDAEGQEERILAGGRNFFAQHSPLVMFEIKAGNATNQNLLTAFPRLGYQLFRLLVGAPVLVPIDPGAPLDPYELNLFAAKPDRVSSLRDEGFLADEIAAWEPNSEDISSGLSQLRQQSFGPMIDQAIERSRIEPDYAKSLAAFATWRNADLPARTRCAALFYAYRTLAALCNRAPTTARFSSFARLAWEGGWRGGATVALGQMAAHIRHTPFAPNEPCWPADPGLTISQPAATRRSGLRHQSRNNWNVRTASQPALAGYRLGWRGCASSPLLRRRCIGAKSCLLRGAERIRASRLACETESPNHLNAELWRAGLVPGTRVDS